MGTRCFLVEVVIATALLFSTDAVAGRFCLGNSEELRFVADTRLKDSLGRSLQLARKQTVRCFLAPYWVSNDGLVLQLKGAKESYYPMPNEYELAALQSAGLIPNPLPESSIGFWDRVWGHFLIILLAVAYTPQVWAYIKARRSGRSR